VGFEKNWAFGERFMCFLFSVNSEKIPKYLSFCSGNQNKTKQNKTNCIKKTSSSSILFVTSYLPAPLSCGVVTTTCQMMLTQLTYMLLEASGKMPQCGTKWP
jgi:hypothetical protein